MSKPAQLLLFRHDVLRPGARGGTSVYRGHRGLPTPRPAPATPLRSAPGARRPLPDSPMVVAYGAGVDSTAVLVEMVQRGIRPDAILFADTGAEKPETYGYLPIMDAYLRAHGFPGVTVVRYTPERAAYDSLTGNCTVNETIPSVGLGGHSCSLKWKVEPQERWTKGWEPARAAWAAGRPVLKVIGYDDSDRDQARARKTYQPGGEGDRYAYWYPLQEWHINREEAQRRIAAAGLPVPVKSACFFCPASQADEVVALGQQHPELAAIAVGMEDRARGGKHPLRSRPGLGLSAKQTWRSLIAHLPAVRAALERLPASARFGSTVTFDRQAIPGQTLGKDGAWRVDVDTITPALQAGIAATTKARGRVHLTRGHLDNWDAVLDRYDTVVDGVKAPRRLYVEMPGVAGNQDATLRVVRHYAPRIQALIKRGVRALVPVQPGGRPLSAAYRATVEALGTADFAVLVPATVGASQLRDLASQAPSGVHLAGARPRDAVDTIRSASPATSVTAEQLTKAMPPATAAVFLKSQWGRA